MERLGPCSNRIKMHAEGNVLGASAFDFGPIFVAATRGAGFRTAFLPLMTQINADT
jgi:hypothetical protein